MGLQLRPLKGETSMRGKSLLVVSIVMVSLMVLAPIVRGQVTLRWVFPGTADVERDYAVKIVDAFNQTHPDIKLETEFIGWGQVSDKVTAMYMSGNPPDMVWCSIRRAADFWSMGALIPITKWLPQYDELDKFYPYLLESLTIEGELYTLPTMNEMRTTGGQMRGEKIRHFWGPLSLCNTWSDYLSLVQTCHNKDYDGDGKIDTYGIFMSAQQYMPMEDQLESFARNNGPMDLTDILDPSLEKQWIETLDYLKSLSEYRMPGNLTMVFTDRNRAFAEERVVIIPGTGSWVFGNQWTINPDGLVPSKLGRIIGPTGPSHRGPALAAATGYGPFISKNIPEEHQEAAWEYIVFQANKKNAGRFPGIMHVPSRIDVSVEDAMEFSPYPRELYLPYQQMWLRIAPHAIVRVVPPGFGEMSKIMATAILDMYRGEASAEETYHTIYPQIEELWESRGYTPEYLK